MDELLKIPDKLTLSQKELECIRHEISQLPKQEDLDMYMNFVLATIRFSEAASNEVARMTKGNAVSGEENPHFMNPSVYTKNELSVRTARAWQRYARAFSWFAGKDVVDKESVKTVFPYVTWHKLQPTEKAIQESWKAANDRIGFVSNLLEKIDEDWELVCGDDHIKYWGSALNAIKSGADKLQNIVSKAIQHILLWDHPYALSLAKHLETEYNQRVMS